MSVSSPNAPDADASFEYEGVWGGELTTIADLGGFTLCSGSLDLTVEDDGSFSGDGICSSFGSETEVEIEGEFDDDFNAEGTVFLSSFLGDAEKSLSGSVGEDGVLLEWRVDELGATGYFKTE